MPRKQRKVQIAERIGVKKKMELPREALVDIAKSYGIRTFLKRTKMIRVELDVIKAVEAQIREGRWNADKSLHQLRLQKIKVTPEMERAFKALEKTYWKKKK